MPLPTIIFHLNNPSPSMARYLQRATTAPLCLHSVNLTKPFSFCFFPKAGSPVLTSQPEFTQSYPLAFSAIDFCPVSTSYKSLSVLSCFQIKHAAQARALQAQISTHNLFHAQKHVVSTVHNYTTSRAYLH